MRIIATKVVKSYNQLFSILSQLVVATLACRSSILSSQMIVVKHLLFQFTFRIKHAFTPHTISSHFMLYHFQSCLLSRLSRFSVISFINVYCQIFNTIYKVFNAVRSSKLLVFAAILKRLNLGAPVATNTTGNVFL